MMKKLTSKSLKKIVLNFFIEKFWDRVNGCNLERIDSELEITQEIEEKIDKLVAELPNLANKESIIRLLSYNAEFKFAIRTMIRIAMVNLFKRNICNNSTFKCGDIVNYSITEGGKQMTGRLPVMRSYGKNHLILKEFNRSSFVVVSDLECDLDTSYDNNGL